jgi:inner membrane protein
VVWWRSAIILCFIYLAYTNINKLIIDRDIKATLNTNQLGKLDYLTTPGPFNSWLWFITIKADSGFYTGFHSVFDKDNKVELHYFPRNDSLLGEVKNKDDLRNLLQFSEGYYTIEKWNDTLVFNVLRFGQVIGWHDPTEKFVLHYFLDRPGANEMVTQRGRFEKWNRETIHSIIRRIKGY